MTRTNQTGHVRARYGMCLNDQCSKAKAKEVQEIPARKEFVCEECGKPLRECPPPPPPTNWLKFVLIGVAVVVLAGGGWYFFSSGDTKEQPQGVNELPVIVQEESVDTTAAPVVVEEPETPAKTPAPKDPAPKVLNGRGTVDLGYGTYTGELKNGKPHGYGVITYKTSHKIMPSKDYVANPGDTFEGDFRDGKISGLGYWKHDGNQTAVKP